MLSLTKIPIYTDLASTYQKPDLFLFDMDGTLLNTEFIHAQSIETLIEGKITADAIMKRFIGMSDRAVFEILSKELNLKVDANQIIDRKNQELVRIIKNLSNDQLEMVFPKAMKKYFNDLKSIGKKIALVTASESIIAHVLMEKLDLDKQLDLIVTYQTTYQSKPNPSPYLYALRFFKKHADECLIMEDSITGLEAAKLCGTKLIKALWFHV